MSTIVNDDLISFKVFEENIYNYICELGREITKIILESYDKELAKIRYYRRTGKHQKGKRFAHDHLTQSILLLYLITLVQCGKIFTEDMTCF